MSKITGSILAIVLSLGRKPKEWHQRVMVQHPTPLEYDLYPGDGTEPTRIEFIKRPYQPENDKVGVTPESLLFVVAHYLDQPDADEDTRLAVKHIEQALALLHAEQPTEKD